MRIKVILCYIIAKKNEKNKENDNQINKIDIKGDEKKDNNNPDNTIETKRRREERKRH